MSANFVESDDQVSFNGVVMEKTPGLFTPRILRSMRLGRFETAEMRLAERALQQGDRILDIGAGVGFLTARLAKSENVAAVLAVEANPALIDVITSTAARNGVADKITCRHGILANSADPGGVDFYVRRNFWASSLSGDQRAYVDVLKVPVWAFDDVIRQFQPTMIVCDIEGGEIDLLAKFEPGPVTRIVIETHPGLYGTDGLAQVFRSLLDHDFVLDIKAPRIGDVLTFEKVTPVAVVKSDRAV